MKKVVIVDVDANLDGYLNKMKLAGKAVNDFEGNIKKTDGTLKSQESVINSLSGAIVRLGIAAKSVEFGVGLGKNVIVLERLNIAMKNVTAASNSFGQSQSFLDSVTNKYGQSLLNVQKGYNNFIASSESSNLSIRERQKIFESIIQTGASYQLSNYNIEKSLLAVSQMFSKGTVQAEELRQQLGDHLPGAYSLMAKALGMSEQKMADMMKKGLIPAGDALQKFGALLSEMNAEKASENLKTVSGSFNLLRNETLKSASAFNEQYKITESIAGVFRNVAGNISTYSSALAALSAALVIYKGAAMAGSYATRLHTASLATATVATQRLTFSQSAAVLSTRALSLAMSALPWAAAAAAIYVAVEAYRAHNKESIEAAKRQEELKDKVSQYTGETSKQKVQLEALSKALFNANTPLFRQEEIFKEITRIAPKATDGIAKFEGNQAKVKASIDKVNASLGAQIDLLALQAEQDVQVGSATSRRQRLNQLEREIPESNTRDVWRFSMDRLVGAEAGRAIYKDSDRNIKLREYNQLLKEQEKSLPKIEETSQKILEIQKKWGFDQGSATTTGGGGGASSAENELKKRIESESKLIKQTEDLSISALRSEEARDIAAALASNRRAIDSVNSEIAGEEFKKASILALQEDLTRQLAEINDKYRNAEAQKDQSAFEKLKANAIELSRITQLAKSPSADGSTLNIGKFTSDTLNAEIMARKHGGKPDLFNAEYAYQQEQEFNKAIHDIGVSGKRAIQEEIVFGLGDTMTAAFQSLFDKDYKFGDNFRKILGNLLSGLGDIVMKMGAQYIAVGTTKLVAETALMTFGNGAGAIAGGAALLAIGAAMKGGGGAMSKGSTSGAGSSGVNSSARGGSGSGFSYGSTPRIQVQMTGELKGKGSDLIGVIKNTNIQYG